MSGKMHLAIVLLLLPLLVIGHDVYFWNSAKYSFANFRLSELGFMWVEYAPDSYDTMVEMVGKETWKTYAFPLMKLKTAYLAAFPSLVLFILGLRDLLKNSFSDMASKKSRKQGPSKKGSRNFSPEMRERLYGKKSKDNNDF